MNKKYIVRLSDEERSSCQEVIKKLKGSSQKFRRAQILGGVLRLLNKVNLWYVRRYCLEPVLSDARVTEVSPCRRTCPVSVA
jgi:hypothetical protein